MYHLLNHCAHWRTFKFFALWGYYEKSLCKHSCTGFYMNLRFHFSIVKTYKWSIWVTMASVWVILWVNCQGFFQRGCITLHSSNFMRAPYSCQALLLSGFVVFFCFSFSILPIFMMCSAILLCFNQHFPNDWWCWTWFYVPIG